MTLRYTHAQARNLRTQLGSRDQASGLNCPVCYGGGSGERSVTAWRQGLELGAKCWRNKCGAWGKFDIIDLGGVPKPVDYRPDKPQGFILQTLPLTEASVAALEARYRLHPETLRRYGLRQSTAGRAWYCPVQGPTGKFRGWVRRWAEKPASMPKVQSYPAPEHPPEAAWLAWFRPAGVLAEMGTPLVLVAVEDVFSAMRLAQEGVPSVCLLGTAMGNLKAAEMRRFSTGPVVVALDADAYQRAIGHALRYTIEVRRLETDIKDMTPEQLATWIHSLYTSLAASPPGMPVTSLQRPG